MAGRVRRVGLIGAMLVALVGRSWGAEVKVPDRARLVAELQKIGSEDTTLLLTGGDSYAGGVKYARRPKGRVTLDGCGSAVIRGGVDGLNLQNVDGLTVKNLTVLGSKSSGVRVTGQNIRFENVTVNGAEMWGWLISSDSTTLVACAGLNTHEQHGFYIQQFADKVTLDHCIASGNGTCGVQVNVGSNITLTDCTITGNGSVAKGAAVNLINAGQVTLTNCTIRDNLWQGLSLGGATTHSTVTMDGGEITFQLGSGGMACNVGDGGTLTLNGVRVEMGIVKTGRKLPSTFWADVTGGKLVTDAGCTFKPAAAVVAR